MAVELKAAKDRNRVIDKEYLAQLELKEKDIDVEKNRLATVNTEMQEKISKIEQQRDEEISKKESLKGELDELKFLQEEQKKNVDNWTIAMTRLERYMEKCKDVIDQGNEQEEISGDGVQFTSSQISQLMTFMDEMIKNSKNNIPITTGDQIPDSHEVKCQKALEKDQKKRERYDTKKQTLLERQQKEVDNLKLELDTARKDAEDSLREAVTNANALTNANEKARKAQEEAKLTMSKNNSNFNLNDINNNIANLDSSQLNKIVTNHRASIQKILAKVENALAGTSEQDEFTRESLSDAKTSIVEALKIMDRTSWDQKVTNPAGLGLNSDNDNINTDVKERAASSVRELQNTGEVLEQLKSEVDDKVADAVNQIASVANSNTNVANSNEEASQIAASVVQDIGQEVKDKLEEATQKMVEVTVQTQILQEKVETLTVERETLLKQSQEKDQDLTVMRDVVSDQKKKINELELGSKAITSSRNTAKNSVINNAAARSQNLNPTTSSNLAKQSQNLSASASQSGRPSSTSRSPAGPRSSATNPKKSVNSITASSDRQSFHSGGTKEATTSNMGSASQSFISGPPQSQDGGTASQQQQGGVPTPSSNSTPSQGKTQTQSQNLGTSSRSGGRQSQVRSSVTGRQSAINMGTSSAQIEGQHKSPIDHQYDSDYLDGPGDSMTEIVHAANVTVVTNGINTVESSPLNPKSDTNNSVSNSIGKFQSPNVIQQQNLLSKTSINSKATSGSNSNGKSQTKNLSNSLRSPLINVIKGVNTPTGNPQLFYGEKSKQVNQSINSISDHSAAVNKLINKVNSDIGKEAMTLNANNINDEASYDDCQFSPVELTDDYFFPKVDGKSNMIKFNKSLITGPGGVTVDQDLAVEGGQLADRSETQSLQNNESPDNGTVAKLEEQFVIKTENRKSEARSLMTEKDHDETNGTSTVITPTKTNVNKSSQSTDKKSKTKTGSAVASNVSSESGTSKSKKSQINSEISSSSTTKKSKFKKVQQINDTVPTSIPISVAHPKSVGISPAGVPGDIDDDDDFHLPPRQRRLKSTLDGPTYRGPPHLRRQSPLLQRHSETQSPLLMNLNTQSFNLNPLPSSAGKESSLGLNESESLITDYNSENNFEKFESDYNAINGGQNASGSSSSSSSSSASSGTSSSSGTYRVRNQATKNLEGHHKKLPNDSISSQQSHKTQSQKQNLNQSQKSMSYQMRSAFEALQGSSEITNSSLSSDSNFGDYQNSMHLEGEHQQENCSLSTMGINSHLSSQKSTPTDSDYHCQVDDQKSHNDPITGLIDTDSLVTPGNYTVSHLKQEIMKKKDLNLNKLADPQTAVEVTLRGFQEDVLVRTVIERANNSTKSDLDIVENKEKDDVNNNGNALESSEKSTKSTTNDDDNDNILSNHDQTAAAQTESSKTSTKIDSDLAPADDTNFLVRKSDAEMTQSESATKPVKEESNDKNDQVHTVTAEPMIIEEIPQMLLDSESSVSDEIVLPPKQKSTQFVQAASVIGGVSASSKDTVTVNVTTDDVNDKNETTSVTTDNDWIKKTIGYHSVEEEGDQSDGDGEKNDINEKDEDIMIPKKQSPEPTPIFTSIQNQMNQNLSTVGVSDKASSSSSKPPQFRRNSNNVKSVNKAPSVVTEESVSEAQSVTMSSNKNENQGGLDLDEDSQNLGPNESEYDDQDQNWNESDLNWQNQYQQYEKLNEWTDAEWQDYQNNLNGNTQQYESESGYWNENGEWIENEEEEEGKFDQEEGEHNHDYYPYHDADSYEEALTRSVTGSEIYQQVSNNNQCKSKNHNNNSSDSSMWNSMVNWLSGGGEKTGKKSPMQIEAERHLKSQKSGNKNINTTGSAESESDHQYNTNFKPSRRILAAQNNSMIKSRQAKTRENQQYQLSSTIKKGLRPVDFETIVETEKKQIQGQLENQQVITNDNAESELLQTDAVPVTSVSKKTIKVPTTTSNFKSKTLKSENSINGVVKGVPIIQNESPMLPQSQSYSSAKKQNTVTMNTSTRSNLKGNSNSKGALISKSSLPPRQRLASTGIPTTVAEEVVLAAFQKRLPDLEFMTALATKTGSGIDIPFENRSAMQWLEKCDFSKDGGLGGRVHMRYTAWFLQQKKQLAAAVVAGKVGPKGGKGGGVKGGVINNSTQLGKGGPGSGPSNLKVMANSAANNRSKYVNYIIEDDQDSESEYKSASYQDIANIINSEARNNSVGATMSADSNPNTMSLHDRMSIAKNQAKRMNNHIPSNTNTSTNMRSLETNHYNIKSSSKLSSVNSGYSGVDHLIDHTSESDDTSSDINSNNTNNNLNAEEIASIYNPGVMQQKAVASYNRSGIPTLGRGSWTRVPELGVRYS